MIWAACCLGFFTFLRAGEMTAPSDAGYDPTVHLSPGDIGVDDPRSPSVLSITLKQSKTDPSRQGVTLYVGRTRSELFPVAAVFDYLRVRGSSIGPLFTLSDGRFLTK